MSATETFGPLPAFPPVIGLSGAAGAGKSTLAALLASRCGYERLRFASPLKAMARGFYASLGMPDDEIERRIEGDLKELPDPALFGETPRRMMQTLGTEWGRQCMGEDFWTMTASVAACRKLHAGLPVVFEDCRFENEAATVRALGGIVVRIDRPSAGGLASGHVSESGVEPDLTIMNDGTPDDLFDALIAALPVKA
jgi:hypothetical protein